ncbi:class I SAM-dependent methyltransferase [Aquimarina sp. 2201CG5-10]|uniref:class I SAM-dependent methyltransferase n=1 Tax=Aquimarina callyspongiae TaxID=3098150 RepID=UPI002AB5407A|nr:class I SAM-dependent methyltransferase [Aquimarina sp. 2201CG5-10]MDY8134322.1 class I SAM-dependent methyltransferase [Aquimarina sp. 2201CG5-10]
MSSKIRIVFVEILASTLGNLLVVLRPEKARQLSEKGVTLVLNNLSLTERLMRRAILKNIEKKEDYDTLAELHQNYWTKQGSDFFEATNDTFKNNFLPDCSFIFELLKDELSNQSEEFNTLVEIGTGNGNVLEYLSSEFPKIDHFVGIDLSSIQIDINNKKFHENKKLEFVALDGFEWVKKNGQGNTIFVTSRGVLEYFVEERLQAFLKEINDLGKTIFIAIEPNGTEHNFETNPKSQPYGPERSFSHNYPKLFKDAGFSIWHLSYKPLEESTKLSFIGAKN